MPKRDKTLEKIRQNRRSVRFDELHELLVHYGFNWRPGKGDHVFYWRGSHTLTIRKSTSNVHPKAVKDVLEAIEEFLEEE